MATFSLLYRRCHNVWEAYKIGACTGQARAHVSPQIFCVKFSPQLKTPDLWKGTDLVRLGKAVQTEPTQPLLHGSPVSGSHYRQSIPFVQNSERFPIWELLNFRMIPPPFLYAQLTNCLTVTLNGVLDNTVHDWFHGMEFPICYYYGRASKFQFWQHSGFDMFRSQMLNLHYLSRIWRLPL